MNTNVLPQIHQNHVTNRDCKICAKTVSQTNLCQIAAYNPLRRRPDGQNQHVAAVEWRMQTQILVQMLSSLLKLAP